MRTLDQARLPQPDLAEVEIGTVLQALADPVRLQIVRLLSRQGTAACGELDVPVKRSTVSHHLRTLRETGLLETHLKGNTRVSKVRREELDRRFPGLLASILDAAPAVPAAPPEEEPGGADGER
ncbi:ArsR family transcriptional regulator [Streptomyces eurocidicus]|uniref:ArsR family transcriptional regulator n=1 Tax=Streptomyces eurocidicus TaxID=66423 RepID=A0A2N8P0Q1_STREU|nr:metalloregulator ArsR/SmtB family transcription factor [Streptomyces eurocidicus]MBB5122047.1 DNA-binding transcriptional ArsR family regulator [Streptomyces eurocidicus]MBF6055380.1 metalloregulator ArsR/SmtB family transcription factor [Streptomyces eurocidicus]PNE34569.1 ArsR family transcriptional regulator [Streptomyces eurocidicus]